MKSEKGFTIVELLIVIVVIGILAAIVIVAYSGVTNRANNTDSTAAATTVNKKAEAYNSDPLGGNGSYPTTFAQLSGAASSQTFSLAGSGVVLQATALASKPSNAKTVNFYTCGAAVGSAVGFWNYNTDALNYLYTGGGQGTNGSLTALPTAGATCTISAT